MADKLFIDRLAKEVRLCTRGTDPRPITTSRSCRLEPLDLDQAPSRVGILGNKPGQSRRRLQLVQQAQGQPAVKRADHRLVLVHRLAIRAVAEPKSNPSGLGPLALGCKPQGGEGPAHRLLSP